MAEPDPEEYLGDDLSVDWEGLGQQGFKSILLTVFALITSTVLGLRETLQPFYDGLASWLEEYVVAYVVDPTQIALSSGLTAGAVADLQRAGPFGWFLALAAVLATLYIVREGLRLGVRILG